MWMTKQFLKIIGKGADGLHRFERIPAFLKLQTIPLDHLAGEQVVDVEGEGHGYGIK